MSQAASAPVANTASPAPQTADGGQVATTTSATDINRQDGGSSAVSQDAHEPREPRELGSTESIMDALADMDGDAASGEPDTGGESGSHVETEQSAPAADAPATWSPEEKAMFGQLPPALQQAVVRRETERERFAHAKAQETALARHQLGQLTQWAHQRMEQSLQVAQMSIEGDFAGIDWLALQKADPGTYLQLDAARRERYAMLQQTAAEHQRLSEFGMHQLRQAEAERLQGEYNAVMPQLAAVLGADMDKASVRKDVAAYLRSIGAPPEHIDGISHAYQLSMAVKAMLWDKAADTRAQAAQKVAAAPKVQKTSGRGTDSAERDPGRARDALRRNGSSTENVANALKHLGF